jgi:hypothetical protein
VKKKYGRSSYIGRDEIDAESTLNHGTLTFAIRVIRGKSGKNHTPKWASKQLVQGVSKLFDNKQSADVTF